AFFTCHPRESGGPGQVTERLLWIPAFAGMTTQINWHESISGRPHRMPVQKTISPIDGSVYVERKLATRPEVAKAVEAARKAQVTWKQVPVAERGKVVGKAVDWFVANKDKIAEELTRQIGRPISQSPGELRGFEERARYMIEVAPDALADVDAGPKAG